MTGPYHGRISGRDELKSEKNEVDSLEKEERPTSISSHGRTCPVPGENTAVNKVKKVSF